MSIVRPLVATIAAAGLPVVLAAAEVRQVSLDDCLQLAIQKNLDVRIAQYTPMLTRLSLSSAYWTYEPTLSAGVRQSFSQSEAQRIVGGFNPPANESWNERYDTSVNGTIPTGMSYSLSGLMNRQSGEQGGFDQGFFYTPAVSMNVTQPLLRNFWIDQPRLTIQLEKRNLKQGEYDIRDQVIRTSTEVTLAYLDLIAARENLRVQQKALELAERSLQENKKRVEVGAMAPLDEKEAAAQAARSRADVISSERDLALAQNALKRLITDDFAGLQEVLYEPTARLTAVPETFNRIDSWHKGLSLRPDIQRNKLELEKQRITLRFTRNQLYPQLDMLGSFGLGGADPNFGPSLNDIEERRNPNYSAGLRLSMPFTNKRARNDHQAAKLRNEQLLLRYKQLEQSAMVEIENAIRSADAALQRVQATEASMEYSEAALQAEEKTLENGKSTSFVVLQRQRDYTSAQSEVIRSKSDYNKALARLAQAEGFTLEKYQVRLELK
jgi:hypothetical protein